MSLIKAIRAQLGMSGTATNNFTLDASAADGSMKLARGNAGVTTQDVLSVAADGKVDFPAGLAAFLGANQSLAASGYQKLPGGLIVQWASGTLSATTAVQYQVLSFPIPFTTACYAVSLSHNGTAASAGPNNRVSVEPSPTASGFTAAHSSVSSATITYYYIAIGK